MAAIAGSVRVGTAGWDYDDWKGVVYPDPAPRGFHPLLSLAGFLDCVEVNATFYRIPGPRAAASWAERIAGRPGFLFSAKLWQGFTHADAPAPPKAVEEMGRALEPLREAGRLAAVLVQFPWSFADTPAARARLEALAGDFRGWPLALEVRHRSWLAPDAVRKIGELGYSFCNIDQPASKTGVYPTALVTGPVGYVRLHGRNAAAWFDREAGRDQRYDYLYSPAELEKWVKRIEQVRARADLALVIANNHFRGQAVANAVQLRGLLGLAPAPLPAPLVAAFPALGTLGT